MINKETRKRSYTYDEMNRLRSVTGEDGRSLVITYDATGNRVSVSGTGGAIPPAPVAAPAASPAGPPPSVHVPPPQKIPSAEPAPSCPACGAPVKPGAKFCGSCGADLSLPAGPPTCPRCGQEVREGAKFCNKCGQKLG